MSTRKYLGQRGAVEFIGFGHYDNPSERVPLEQFLRWRQSQFGSTEGYEPVPESVISKVGIEFRLEPKVSLLEMAKVSAEMALNDAQTRHQGFDRQRCGVLMSGGSTPDRLYPPGACRLQDMLGLPSVQFGHDVSAACSSGTEAILTTSALMRTHRIPVGLVVIPDLTGKCVANPRKRNSFLWGNGSGALVVSYNPKGSQRVGLIGATGAFDGSKADWVVCRGALGVNPAIVTEESDVDLERFGPWIQRYILENLPSLIKSHLKANGHNVGDRTFLLPHNANLDMVNGVGERIGIPPERVLTSLKEYGNTSGASILITMSRYKEGFESGDLLILASFGAGMILQVCLYVWP